MSEDLLRAGSPRSIRTDRVRRRVGSSQVSRVAVRAVTYSILSLWAAFALMPVVWFVSLASRTATELLTTPLRLLPSQFLLFENIASVFEHVPFAAWIRNSLLMVVVLAIIDAMVSSSAGYALAKFKFPGRQVFFHFILGILMISFIVIIVPLYILVKQLGWLNTYMGMMAPVLVSAFGVFFMRQHCLTIPEEYLDAARVDGASEIRIFRTVVTPMVRPAIVTLVIFRFLWEWDRVLWPLIVVGKSSLWPLPLGLATMPDMAGQQLYSMTVVYAANLLAVAPVVVVFLVLQRYFTNAMLGSGLKL